jgi:2-keto-4-pentenoate hydratase
MTSKVEIFGAALGKAIRRTTDKIRDGQFDRKDRGPPMNAWDDPRIARGMEKQLAVRRARIAAGEKPLGWKVGLGAPPAMERLKIRGPLVGFMMQRSLLPDGCTASLAGWHQPIAEPEVAVYMGADLPGGADRTATAAAIAALGPAIELVDLNPPPNDVEAALAGNIYHRHVILGERDTSRAGAKVEELSGHVFRRGALAAKQDNVQALIGEMIGIVQHVAGTLAAYGEKLSAGDVIITGSIVPAPMIEPDETEFAYALEPVGRLSVRFSR